MISLRASRSPLVSLILTGSLVLVACGSDTGDVITSPYTHGSYGGGSKGSGSTGSGSTTGGGGSASNTGGSSSTGSTGNGATSGNTGNSSGSTTTGTGSTGTGTGDGNGGTTTPPPPAAPTFGVTVDNAAPSMNLASTTVLNVTVTSTNNWAGAVTLSTATLPTDVTGAFDNATVNITATTPGTAKLTLTSVSSTAPVATPFTVIGTADAVVMNMAATLTVKPYITIHIPVNADSLTSSFGTVKITAPADIASNPVTVNIVNDDSTPHEVHADNPNQGFAHGQGTFAQGEADSPVRKVTVAGTYNWHLHDDAPPGGPPGGTVVIQ